MNRKFGFLKTVGPAAARSFSRRYKGTILGFAWPIALPLTMIFIYTVIFSRIMGARLGTDSGPLDYSIFLMSGLIPWTVFATLVTVLTGAFASNAAVIKNSTGTRYIIPLSEAAPPIFDFMILTVLFFGIAFLFVEVRLTGALSYLISSLVFILAGFGVGILLGTLNVFFRDVGQSVSVVLQLGFWLTPIVYPISIVPEQVQGALMFNPFLQIVSVAQDGMLNNRLALDLGFGIVLAVIIGILIFGSWLLRRTMSHMAEFL